MKATLVFCEGPHDVWFLYKLLLSNDGISGYKKELKHYPQPLPGFLTKRMEARRFAEQKAESLGRSEPPLLCAAASKDQQLWLFFDCNGDDKLQVVRQFLEQLAENCTMGPVGGGLLSAAAEPQLEPNFTVLYCCDADYLNIRNQPSGGRKNKLARIRQDLQGFAGAHDTDSWEAGRWYQWQGERSGLPETWSFGCLIFAAPGQEEGTLEDLVLPVLEKHPRFPLEQARVFIRENVDALETCPLKDAESPAKRKKAEIGAAGQFFEPGTSIAVIFKGDKKKEVLLRDVLLADKACSSIADFLLGTPAPAASTPAVAVTQDPVLAGAPKAAPALAG